MALDSRPPLLGVPRDASRVRQKKILDLVYNLLDRNPVLLNSRKPNSGGPTMRDVVPQPNNAVERGLSFVNNVGYLSPKP